MNNKQIQTNIEKFSKLNTWLVSGSIFCMFTYVIMLGLTAANVVNLRTVAKSVEDTKTELSTVELGYMTDKNIMALENDYSSTFSLATNIAYVDSTASDSKNSVALANSNR